METKKLSLLNRISPFIIILIISALAYLPYIYRLGYYRDDWYYMVDGYFGGPKIFHTMFYIDRPARGYLFELLFRLFSTNATFYLLMMYFWRVFAAFTGYNLLKIIWPNKHRSNLLSALLFAVYPGFLWWVSGIEYQPIIIALAMQTISFYLTLLTLRSERLFYKSVYFVGSFITGLIAIFLVDYAIGMELFRIILIFWFLKSNIVPNIRKALKIAIYKSLPFLTIPLGYLYWRIFRFSNARPDTDITLQTSSLFTQNPIPTLLTWSTNLLKSLFSVIIKGWIEPLIFNFGTLSFVNKIICLVIAMAGLIFAYEILRNIQDDPGTIPQYSRKLTIIGSILGVMGGAIPIVIMNRTILIQRYSHYALPALLCAAIIVVEFAHSSKRQLINFGVPLFLVTIALFSINSQAINVLDEETKIKEFWQQFTIRVPYLKKETTLLVNYPGIPYGEDVEIVWAPATLVYLSKNEVITTSGILQYPYSGIKINEDILKSIATENPLDLSYRSHANIVNINHLLVVSQPTIYSCVHVMDQKWPRLNESDPYYISISSPKSKISNVIINNNEHPINTDFIGTSDSQGWCQFYEKAELEIQRGDWKSAASTFNKAFDFGLEPVDIVEWIPVFQTALITGNTDMQNLIADKLNEFPYYTNQACGVMNMMQIEGILPDSRVSPVRDQLHCK